MVEFMSAYLPAMERFEERPITPMETVEADIEKPLIPIGEIGTTSVDMGRGHILQELEKNINMGTKKIQLVFSTPQGSSPSKHGKDVRQAVREKAKATGVEIIGTELAPGVISGLAGFDPQSGRISEERRQADLKKVRDAVRFAADVAGGGAVDLWSQEFQRTIYDADWNKNPQNKEAKDWAGMFYDYSPKELSKDPADEKEKPNIVKYLVDSRTGQPIQQSVVRTKDEIFELKFMTAADYDKHFGTNMVGQTDPNGKVIGAKDYIDIKGRVRNKDDLDAQKDLIPYMDPKTHQVKTEKVGWDEIARRAAEYNKGKAKEDQLSPEEFMMRQKLETQIALTRGQTLYYTTELETYYDRLKYLSDLQKMAKDLEKNMTKEEQMNWFRNVLQPQAAREGIGLGITNRTADLPPSEIIQSEIHQLDNLIHSRQEQAMAHAIQEDELKQARDNIETPEKYAFKRSTEGYAEAGIDAMRVTQERKLKSEGGSLDKPIYIGPELGWAGESFGGHPEEFVKLIKESRKVMAKRLENEGYDPSTASEKAKTHIKGMVDTSHLAMWFKHFQKKPGWSDEKHLKEFNEWMKAQARFMVKEGVVGGVQVVDSITGEHSHLPAGQGQFDVAGFVKEMKKEGFNGPIISEGHEEDAFGQGRILSEAWRAFGANISSVPTQGPMGLRSWGGIQNSYFGRVTPPTYIVGAYAPSNEWSLWTETPFE